MPVTNLRPMLPAERELMLAIVSACWAINEQTSKAADCDVSGHTGLCYITVYKDKDDTDLFETDFFSDNENMGVSFTDLYPDNTAKLMLLLAKLAEYLPTDTGIGVLYHLTAQSESQS